MPRGRRVARRHGRTSALLIVMAMVATVMMVPLAGSAHTEGEPFTTDLIADGRADPPDVPVVVGEVEVWNDAANLHVGYKITDPDWCLIETHLAVEMDSALIPQTKKHNPIPGKFEYSGVHDCETDVLYEIPMMWDVDDELAIAAHANVWDVSSVVAETAWGDGTDFDGKNWATFFGYIVQGGNTATGSAYWENRSGVEFYADFNVHEAFDGRPAKGGLLQERVDGTGGFTVDVTEVVVGERLGYEYACFGGFVEEAWGSLLFAKDLFRWTIVVDGGESGVYVDGIKGNFLFGPPLPGSCLSGSAQRYDLTSGNIQVQFGG